jgi:hypothetical protein
MAEIKIPKIPGTYGDGYGCSLPDSFLASHRVGEPTVYGCGGVTLGPLSFTVLSVEKSGTRISVICQVPDRETRSPVRIRFDFNLTPEQMCLSYEDQVRHVVRRAMEHELDEQIYVERKRVFDPHAPQRITMTFA